MPQPPHRGLATPEHINARGDWRVLLPIDTMPKAATIAPDYNSGRGSAGVAKSAPIVDIITFIDNRRNWRWKGCLWCEPETIWCLYVRRWRESIPPLTRLEIMVKNRGATATSTPQCSDVLSVPRLGTSGEYRVSTIL